MVDRLSGTRVLVTGAGGWLGGAVAAALTQRGADVTALARRPGPVLGNDGAPVPVARALTGDLGLPRLGWDGARWRHEAGSHDLIVHCAALTRFDADPALAEAVNVGGTAEIVELARAGRAGLLHVSTAYVNGMRDGRVLEDERPGGGFNNVYEQSKAAAERLVRSAGIPAAIVRPSIVLGDYRDGRVRRFGTFYYLLKLLAEGRVATIPATPGATLDLVPVDHVVSSVVAIAGRFHAAAGLTFHLVADNPTPVTAIAATLARFDGLAVPSFVPPHRFVPQDDRAWGRLIGPYLPYFRRAPRFDDANLRRLAGSGCDPVEAGWWERLVRFALDAGFLQASRTRPNGSRSEARTPSSAGSR